MIRSQAIPIDTRAIVRPSIAFEHFTLCNWSPEPPLDRFVTRFWKTKWSLPEPFVQTIVTHPVVNLVFQADGSAIVSGVHQQNDERVLSGDGWAFGVMFRCGGFRPFMHESMESLRERRVPISEVFGIGSAELTSSVVEAATDEQRVELVSAFLIKQIRDELTIGESISDLVESTAAEGSAVVRVDQLADRYGTSVRSLQRLFREHVGVSPKWVLERARLHATAQRALKPVTSWADVAQELGYSDQAHLTSAFRTQFGSPPATYARLEAVPSTQTQLQTQE